MATLTPAPSSLGLSSPALGPWFASATSGATLPTLGVPDGDLAVTLAADAGLRWLPPAAGLLSFVVASTPRPPILAPLRKADGTAAFTDGRLVALFRLLPEVEERLDALAMVLAPADGSATATVSPRARVRYLAVELPESPPTIATLAGRVEPGFPNTPAPTDAEKAEALGLRLSGTTILNGRTPMFDLKRPGGSTSGSERLLSFPTAAAGVKLWAFDAGGRAIDPGAVATWWARLAGTDFDNLWADDIPAADRRTAPADANLAVHLVDAHEGPLSATLAARLNVSGLTGTGPVRTANATSGATLAFTAAPDPDDAPVPKLALLPAGSYGNSVSVWPAGPVQSMARDFVRVAALSVEEHLVGQARKSTAAAGTAAARRAADQNRPSTRVEVARSTGPVLLETTDAAAGAVNDVFAGTGATMIVSSVLSVDWGALSALTSLPAASPPEPLPTLVARALTGGGSATGSIVIGQRVAFELAFAASLAGAWVRAWPLGFDDRVGRHFRLDGGSGRVRGDGTVTIVAGLPDGAVAPAAPMSVDIEVVTANGTRLYMDVRFNRPAPVGGTPITLSAATGDLVVCETGSLFSSGLPNDSVPSGATVVVRPATGPLTLVDPATIPAAKRAPATISRGLAAGDLVELTQPAFVGVPAGDTTTAIAATGATVTRETRTGLTRLVQAGAPLPTMERHEIAATRVGPTDASAAIAATPALGRYHELLPHQAGHPGAPGAPELHGPGAALVGPATIAVAEFTRERTSANTAALATAASTPLPVPPDPAGPTRWTAALRTVAAQVEAEPGLDTAALGSSPYPFGDTLANIRGWFSSQGVAIPSATGAAADSIVRALDRRMLAATRGLREAATSLRAAINRAQDLVYIETPAIDDLALGETNDRLHLWQELRNRMDAVPALRTLVCVPVRSLPGWPDPLGRVRDSLLIDASASLRLAREHRVAIFSPAAGPGRTLRLASTTVIVDDAYALTGTAHLWRRGLSYDSSLAVAVFDEALDAGRSAAVRRFRRALVGGRLGLDPSLVPDDPAELVDAIRRLGDRGDSVRLATAAIVAPDPSPTATDRDIWNRDGSLQTGFDPIGWITALTAAVRSALENEVPAGP